MATTQSRAVNPTAPLTAYHGLAESTTPEHNRVAVSTAPLADTSLVGRQIGRDAHYVSPTLAAWVTKAKTAAADMAKQHTPDLRDYLPTLRQATASARAELARLNAEVHAASVAGATSRQLDAIDGLQLAGRKAAKNVIAAGVRQHADAARTRLAEAERVAQAQLDDLPARRPSESDYTQAGELMETLKLMPARLAVPLLEQRLVEQAAKSAKTGLTAAVLPLLRGVYETNADYNTSDVEELITACEITCRDQFFYSAHQTMANVQQLRVKVDMLTEQYAATDGDEAAPACLAARSAFFSDLGAVEPPAGKRLARVEAA